MAGANTKLKVKRLEEVFIPEELEEGGKFMKWSDENSSITQVTLKINKHFLYWIDQNREVDCLDIAAIRDVRTGKWANIPKDSKSRDLAMMGTKEKLENKTMSIFYGGADMCQLSCLNFCSANAAKPKMWSEAVLKIAYSRSTQNPSPACLLEKLYTKLRISTNAQGKIPVRSFVRTFATKDSDKKKVLNALQAVGLISGRISFQGLKIRSKMVTTAMDEMISPSKFTFVDFFTFYVRLLNRQEIDKVFQEMGAKAKPYLTTEQVKNFFNKEQRDPRLNEILYPYCDNEYAHEIIAKYEPNKGFLKKGHLSVDGLSRYLLSSENLVVDPETLTIHQDMDHSLSHYFINSSHNTYLTGHQFTGRSTVEMYRQVLLSGCRCVELDCWDGADEEPIITHGFTMCTEINFRDVIEAINDAAFKTSDYPVILSFENHCSQRQQAKMAQYCKEIFGDSLLTEALEDYPLDPGKPLPTPERLKGKILVKNKKKKVPVQPEGRKSDPKPRKSIPMIQKTMSLDQGRKNPRLSNISNSAFSNVIQEEDAASEVRRGSLPCHLTGSVDPDLIPKGQVKRLQRQNGLAKINEQESYDSTTSGSITTIPDEDEKSTTENPEELVDSESEDEDDLTKKQEQGTAGKESEAGEEMSALVNYIQPVHFHSFDAFEKKNHHYEIFSGVESAALGHVKLKPEEFVNYNKRQLSRIYPKGTRVDSSNYMPQIFWNVGCQLVALNFQTLDLPMQLNMGIFNYNGRAGYILKPHIMRQTSKRFDPFVEKPMDGVVPSTVQIKIISGQFISDKRVNSYVEVDIFGLPFDTHRREHKVKSTSSNGISPTYEEATFTVEKVIMPDLTNIRIAVSEENGKFVGHRILPVKSIRPGFHHIPLKNESNQPLMMPTLFVHIKVKDYVPQGLNEFIAALENPIAYQDEILKREAQLKALEDDMLMNNLIEDSGHEDVVTSPTDFMPTEQNPLSKTALENRSEQTDSSSEVNEPVDKRKSNSSTDSPVIRVSTSGPIAPTPEVNEPAERTDNGLGYRRTNLSKSSSLGATRFAFEAMEPNNLKQKSVSTPNLGQIAEEVVPTTIEEIRKQKKYVKDTQKLSQLLEKMTKKHEKKVSKMKKEQELEVQKLESSQQKSHKVLEKQHQKEKKRKTTDSEQKIEREMEEFKASQRTQMASLKARQENSMVKLCQGHYKNDLEQKKAHLGIQVEMELELIQRSHAQQLKKNTSLQAKERTQLKKSMETQRSREIKEFLSSSKGPSPSSDLRSMNEIKHKKVQDAVHKVRNLEEEHATKTEELRTKMEEIRTCVEEEGNQAIAGLEQKFHESCQELEQNRRYSKSNLDSNSLSHTNGNGHTYSSQENMHE